MKHITFFAIIALASAMCFSGCTDGEYLGSGGNGNFTFIERSGAYNNQYVWVEGNNGTITVGFSPATPRLQIKGGKVSAPLYVLETGEPYTGSGTFAPGQFTVRIYETATAPLAKSTAISSMSVKFYNGGSGLFEYFQD